MTDLLPIVWFLIIVLEVGLYVLLDGGDLGLGLLSLLPQQESRRSLLMHTVGPIWDANETWLVIAGGTLFGAFPAAYAILLNALYIPAMVLVFGLILRAAAFEFHAQGTHPALWARVFGVGSLLAIVGQGAAAGGLLSGVAVAHGQFVGGPFDWLSPLTLVMIVGVAASYAIVGYSYLLQRTGYEIRPGSFARTAGASGVAFVAFFLATLLLPQVHAQFLERWLTLPSSYFLFSVAAALGVLSLLFFLDIRARRTSRLHTLCKGIFILSLAGMLAGIYPYLAPPSLTIFNTAASSATLTFMLWGIGPLLPIVLAYNLYLYRVFSKPAPGGDGTNGYE